MRTWVQTFAVDAQCSAVISGPESVSALSDQIARTSMRVRDAARARRWYEHVFRMTCILDAPFELVGGLLAVGCDGDAARLLIMQCEGAGSTIGLLEISTELPDEALCTPEELSFHSPVMVVHAVDPDQTFQRAVELGSRVRSRPHDSTLGLKDDELKTVRACSFWDLDGHFYEVLQAPRADNTR